MAQRQNGKEPQLSTLELLLAGMLAGAFAKTAIAPMDRVKILYQVNPDRAFTLQKAMKTIATITRNTGTEGLWRGNMTQMRRIVPYAGVQFLTYARMETWLQQSLGRDKDVTSRFLAGSVAGATATLCTYPFDLVRARLAAHWSLGPKYKPGVLAPYQSIIRNEGFSALFKGLVPTMAGVMPLAGISFCLFETSKIHIKNIRRYNSVTDISSAEHFFAGALSGFTAQSLTYPLQVIRRRAQMEETKGTMRDIVNNIYTKEGLRGFFKGYSLTWLKGPMTVALSFMMNDFVKNSILKQRELEAFGDVVPPVASATETPLSAGEGLIIGGISGAVAKSVIAPGDRIKIIFQASNTHKFSFPAAFRVAQGIVQTSGWSGLWQGNGATVIRVFPYAAITYTTFDRYDEACASFMGVKDWRSRFVAGALAGATATTITYPLDLIRARFAVSSGERLGYAATVRAAVKQDGVWSLWSGLRPTLLGVVPYAGLSFTIFHTSKALLKEKKGWQDKDIPVLVRTAMGGGAGLIAQSATYPLEIVRRRMQVHPHLYSSMTQTFKTVFQNEGLIGGLYKGLWMNWVKGPVAIGISFTLNDTIKEWRRHPHSHNERLH